MKLKTILLTLLLASFGFGSYAQNAKKTVTYPETFSINKDELRHLLSAKTNDIIKEKNNKYLDNSKLQMSSASGDMKSLKLKLNYFPNAYLFVQVNGVYSTQLFVMSDDKSIFYKGNETENNFVMTKCSEDEIVSE